MRKDRRDDVLNEKGYRIRCMKSLVYQIKKDHTQLNGLYERLEKGETDFFLIEELQRF